MGGRQLQLFDSAAAPQPAELEEFVAEIEAFAEFGQQTQKLPFPDPDLDLPVYLNEFWTAKQRAAHSLHEISYRACFKPQLPRFFILRLTRPGEIVYDPFMGRGTTLLEAALWGRVPYGCDLNPLSRILIQPRLQPPSLAAVEARLAQLDLTRPLPLEEELLVFYHPLTLTALTNLKRYLGQREQEGRLDTVDAWIRLVATNRLTGHSPGFFSVYTLPPNQAVSVASQRRINERRQQTPPPRDVPGLILKKSRQLLADLTEAQRRRLGELAARGLVLTGSAEHTPAIADASVSLVVTSPPFLDVVNYQQDNWLRCWFNGLDATQVPVWQLKDPRDWQARMTAVFRELRRLLVPGGYVAFEVGEIRSGRLRLETLVVPAAREAGLTPQLVLINYQKFTKTSQCWGVLNLKKGTNSNRIVLLRKNH